MRCFALAVAAAQLLLVWPAQADDVQSAPSCELHIWAAPALKTVTQSALWNQSVDQAIKGPHPVPGLSAQALPPEEQLTALEATNPGPGLGLASAHVVRHEQPLDEHAAASPDRHDPSSTGCYAELIVSRLVYAADPLAGRSLNILFQFRDFGSAMAPARSFSTWSHRPLLVFPAKTEADSAAADAEIRTAFGESFTDFVANLTKAEVKARKKKS